MTVNADEKKKETEKVADVQVLYEGRAGEKVSGILLFKKTIKVPVAKLQEVGGRRRRRVGVAAHSQGRQRGDVHAVADGRVGRAAGEPAGAAGPAPAGYKLFPMPTVAEVQFEEAKGD